MSLLARNIRLMSYRLGHQWSKSYVLILACVAEEVPLSILGRGVRWWR